DSNELVGQIHDRMPVILHRDDYERWMGTDPDPRDLLRPFASEALRISPISTRVNKPENDDASILDEPGDGRYLSSRTEHQRDEMHDQRAPASVVSISMPERFRRALAIKSVLKCALTVSARGVYLPWPC